VSLEKIIRPFESRDVAPPRPYVAPNAQTGTSISNVTLEAGRKGELKTFNGSYTSSAHLYMDTRQNERKAG
jgi:hypothetical protein